jgi:hypothetical protein
MLNISDEMVPCSKNLYDMIFAIDILEGDAEGFIIGLKNTAYLVKKALAFKMLNIERNRLFQITDDIIPLHCYSNEVIIAALRKSQYDHIVHIFNIKDNCSYNKLRGEMNCSFFWESLQKDTIVYLDPINV